MVDLMPSFHQMCTDLYHSPQPCCFCPYAGFTSMSKALPPGEVMAFLNQ